MPQYGVYANRNAGHKARQAQKYTRARTGAERLAAAHDWLRSSAELLARRRVPKGTDQEVHVRTADVLAGEAAGYLKQLAERIDRGDYDLKRG